MIGWQVKAIAAAVLLAAIGWFLFNYHARGQKIEALEAKVALAADANQSNQDTIAAQKAALKKWADLATSPEQLSQYIKSANQVASQYQLAQAKLDMLKEKDRALPDE